MSLIFKMVPIYILTTNFMNIYLLMLEFRISSIEANLEIQESQWPSKYPNILKGIVTKIHHSGS